MYNMNSSKLVQQLPSIWVCKQESNISFIHTSIKFVLSGGKVKMIKLAAREEILRIIFYSHGTLVY